MTQRTRSWGPVLGERDDYHADLHGTTYTKDEFGVWSPSGPSWQSLDTYDYLTEEYRFMTDVVTPRFHNRMRNGDIIMSPMSSTKRRSEHIPLSINYYAEYLNSVTDPTRRRLEQMTGVISCRSLGFADSSWRVEPYALPAPTLFSESEKGLILQNTVSKCWSKMSDAPLNSWAVIGELDETARTLVTTLLRVRNFLQLCFKKAPKEWHVYRAALRRQGIGLNWRTLRRSKNCWLEMRYGLRPLVYDVRNAIAAFHRLGKKARRRFLVEDFYEKPIVYGTQNGTTDIISSQIQNRSYASVKLKVRAGLLADPKFDTQNLLTLLGTGEMAKGLWELVPYSFVIDWFSSIGSVLQAFAPTPYTTVLGSWATVTEEVTTVRELLSGSENIPSNFNGWGRHVGVLEFSGGHSRTTETSVLRVPNPPRAIMPMFRWNVSILKGVDLAGLVSNFASLR